MGGADHQRARAGPSAFPWPLIDRVLETENGVRAVGLKLVSANEPYFVGHFPGAPVLPGIVLCEAMVQLASRMLPETAGLRLVGVERARFRRPVVPGDTLRLEVQRLETGLPWRLRGTATVAEGPVADVRFTAAPPRAWIDPTARIAPGAELGPGVTVGACAVIGPHVRVGADGWIGPHAVLAGRTTLGARARIFPFASVGMAPQDLKYAGEPSRLELGNDVTIREFASANPGTAGGGMLTQVGHGCLLMVSSHVAHDCRVGSQVVLANGATLGGHVRVDDYAIIGGLTGVHQFVRVGESALCAAGAMVSRDVPPFCTVAGDRARLRGLNVVGLRRRGFGAERIATLRRAYRQLFLGTGPRREAVDRTRESLGAVPEVARLLDFLVASERGICR